MTRTRTRRSSGLAALCLVVLALAVGMAGCSDTTDPEPETVERVLIFSMPGVTWDEVRDADLPNLERLLDTSAVGDVSTRIGRDDASTTAAYLTLGAGTRAVVPGVDMGVALNPDELHAGVPASELLRRRLGRTVDGIAYIPVGATIDANVRSAYGAEPGMLGDALDEAGVKRAVIANADSAEGFPSDQPAPDGAYARSAATALMGSDGVVPLGSVGRGLLQDDPEAPFGRRLDPDAVMRTFDEAWDLVGPEVMLVEASDLARASGYASRSTPEQGERLRADALRDADDLLGRVLERVDLGTDAVMVISPVSNTSLGMVTLHTPRTQGGLLRSASTRRDGYVYLADVAPTVLELVGEEPPDDIEGRPFVASPASGDRTEHLAEQANDAAERDARLPIIVTAVIAGLAVLALATAKREHLPRVARSMLAPAAYLALGIVPGTFLAGLVPATHGGGLAYALVVLGAAAVVAVAATAADRWRPGIGPLVAVGATLVLVSADVLWGAPLQVNSVFGYSMAVAGRFTGLGNLAFALFSSAAVCFAVLCYERFGRTSLPWIALVLAGVVAVDGLPMLGADVGGVISTVPAFVLTVLVLAGRKVRVREVVGSLVLGLAVVGLFGILDSSQPSTSKTHLARIGEHLAAGRMGSVANILWRRIHASFGSDDSLVWIVALGLVGLALAQAFLVATGRVGPFAPVRIRKRTDLALAVGLGALAGLGLVANDSSIAVPATMLIVVVPVLVLRTLDPRPDPPLARTEPE